MTRSDAFAKLAAATARHPVPAGFLAGCGASGFTEAQTRAHVVKAASLGAGIAADFDGFLAELAEIDPDDLGEPTYTKQAADGVPDVGSGYLNQIKNVGGQALSNLGGGALSAIGNGLSRVGHGIVGAAYGAGGTIGATVSGVGSAGHELGYQAGLVGKPQRDAMHAITGTYVRGAAAGVDDLVHTVTPRGNNGNNSAVANMTADNRAFVASRAPSDTVMGMSPNLQSGVIRGADNAATATSLLAAGIGAGGLAGLGGRAAGMAGATAATPTAVPAAAAAATAAAPTAATAAVPTAAAMAATAAVRGLKPQIKGVLRALAGYTASGTVMGAVNTGLSRALPTQAMRDEQQTARQVMLATSEEALRGKRVAVGPDGISFNPPDTPAAAPTEPTSPTSPEATAAEPAAPGAPAAPVPPVPPATPVPPAGQPPAAPSVDDQVDSLHVEFKNGGDPAKLGSKADAVAKEAIVAHAGLTKTNPEKVVNLALKGPLGEEQLPQAMANPSFAAWAQNVVKDPVAAFNGLDNWQKAGVVVGLPMILIGLVQALRGEGGLASMLTTLVGVGAAAYGSGAFAEGGPGAGMTAKVRDGVAAATDPGTNLTTKIKAMTGDHNSMVDMYNNATPAARAAMVAKLPADLKTKLNNGAAQYRMGVQMGVRVSDLDEAVAGEAKTMDVDPVKLLQLLKTWVHSPVSGAGRPAATAAPSP